jgi:undecaprenyl diphosphate synthase
MMAQQSGFRIGCSKVRQLTRLLQCTALCRRVPQQPNGRTDATTIIMPMTTPAAGAGDPSSLPASTETKSGSGGAGAVPDDEDVPMVRLGCGPPGGASDEEDPLPTRRRRRRGRRRRRAARPPPPNSGDSSGSSRRLLVSRRGMTRRWLVGVLASLAVAAFLSSSSSSSSSTVEAWALLQHPQPRIPHSAARISPPSSGQRRCRRTQWRQKSSHDDGAGMQQQRRGEQHRRRPRTYILLQGREPWGAAIGRSRRCASTLLQSWRKSRDGEDDSIEEDEPPASAAAVAASQSLDRLPKHIGFICDGNSRWAQTRNLPAVVGHAAGADRLVEVLQCLRRNHPDVRVCTFYAFSTENWRRTPKEVADIFRVMEATIRQFGPVLLREGVEFRALGDYCDDRIPQSLQRMIDDLHVRTRQEAVRRMAQSSKQSSMERESTSNAEHQQQQWHPVLCVAINYGGRDDIVQAAQRLARRVARGEIDASDITESLLSSHLSTHGIPNPDLIIRTSGECRLSNFFLWDAAYAELRFCDEMWPDFDSESLRRALQWYGARQRRFGSRFASAAATATRGGGKSNHKSSDSEAQSDRPSAHDLVVASNAAATNDRVPGPALVVEQALENVGRTSSP